MTDLTINIVTNHGDVAPTYALPGDAGADLRADHHDVIPPGGRRLIRTGLQIAIPDGYAGFVHPRSGLAWEYGVTVLNAPGTLDSGFRGDVLVNLINHGEEPFHIKPGDRIAQLVIQPVVRAKFVTVTTLDTTERGDNGHGSTGVN